MGNVFTTARSMAVRKARRFNIDNRTDRFIEKGTRSAAPKHAATVSEIERLQNEYPNLMEEINKHDSNLDNRLKQVFVSSTGPSPDKILAPKNPVRPLPSLRDSYEQQEYGYGEGEVSTPGKISLKQAMEALTKHQANKETYTAADLALDYNIKTKDAENLVEYFKVFKLVGVDEELVKVGAHSATDKYIATGDKEMAQVDLMRQEAKEKKKEKELQERKKNRPVNPLDGKIEDN